ncbi:MAG: cytochrome c oxidase subunit 3 [bacterium]
MSRRLSPKWHSVGSGNGHDALVPTKENPAPGAGPFGLAIFLVSLAILFLVSLIAYGILRARAGTWPPPGLPPLPHALWVSTAILALAGVAMETSARAARAHRPERLKIGLAASLALGLAFLVSQTVCWVRYVLAGPAVTLYGWLFFFLTGLHAAHVLGGLVPLVVLTVNAWHDRIAPPGSSGIRLCATYWHFLGVVWVALYGMLLLTS